jgi:hypothetical protein
MLIHTNELFFGRQSDAEKALYILHPPYLQGAVYTHTTFYCQSYHLSGTVFSVLTDADRNYGN